MAGVALRGNVVYEVSVKWDGTNWTDESARCKTIKITRGRDDELSSVNGGACFLAMKDTTGRFNPRNSASPLYAYLSKVREVRVRATYASTTYDLFRGYTRRVESDPGRDAREARIDCIDFFLQLSLARPVIAPQNAATGSAIALVLAAAGFTGTLDMDAGDGIYFAAADGTKTGLGLIAEMLTSERGFFFMSGAGVAVYLARHWQAFSPYTTAQSTISNTMRAIAPGFDLDTVRNRATVTAAWPGYSGTAQTVTAATSAIDPFVADYEAITSAYVFDDNTAHGLAGYLVARRKDGLAPVRFLDMNNGQSSALMAFLARELGDNVAVTDSLGGTSGNYHIQKIEHDIAWSTGLHRCSWGLLARDTGAQPFIIGSSTLGGADILTY